MPPSALPTAARVPPVPGRLPVALALVAAIALVGCGRKGSLETPSAPVLGNALILETNTADRSLGDTVVTDEGRAPVLRRNAGGTAFERAQPETVTADIRGDNADAPEPGDAIAEGPTTGDRVPRRRFILDPLL